RETASSWRRACSRGSLLHYYGNRRPCAQETDCGKATGTATETGRNEAGQRQRYACYGHCAYRRAGQFGRPTWPRRHPEDTRIDGPECAPIEFRRNGEAGYGKTTSRTNTGQCANIRADTTEVGRSCALRRSDKPASRAEPAAERIEGAIARFCAKRDAEFSRDTFKYERRRR